MTSLPQQPRLTCVLALRSRSCSTWRRRESSVGGGVTREAREPQREPERPPPMRPPPARLAAPAAASLAIATSPSRSPTSRSRDSMRASLVSNSAVSVAEVPASAAGPLSPQAPPKLWSCSRRSRSAASRASCSHTHTRQPQAPLLPHPSTAGTINTTAASPRPTLPGLLTTQQSLSVARMRNDFASWNVQALALTVICSL